MGDLKDDPDQKTVRENSSHRAMMTGETSGAVYHHTATLGKSDFSPGAVTASKVSSNGSKGLENPDTLESMASMLPHMLNNVYGRFNEIMQCDELVIPSVIRQSHLDPREQLQDIRNQVSSNRGVIEAVADRTGLGTPGEGVRKADTSLDSMMKRGIEDWSWSILNLLSYIQSSRGHRGYNYEYLGKEAMRALMRPRFSSLADPERMDLDRYLRLLRWKVRSALPLAKLLNRHGFDLDRNILVCNLLRKCRTVESMHEIMKMLEDDVPVDWVVATFQEMRRE